ncbi:unnamed protein product [Pipistrellus nathusii]|uniref:Lymphocyte specific protein 1 n=1 Tax=Pipistrellus nathusii TaxID=59473 RepID=A0ABP0ALL8_PIPNA
MAEAAGQPGSEAQEELLVEEEGAGLATQWSGEEEEEAARERSRRERDGQQKDRDQDGGSPAPEPPEQETLLKASEAPEPEEDEGFGDWAQKSELRQPLRGESPEGEQEEARPCGPQDGDELCPARVSLEELHLHSNSEAQEGPGPEQAEPEDPEETGRGSPGPAEEAEEAEEHQQWQRPGAPSPLLLEATTEPSSPPLSPSTKLLDRTESLSRSIQKSNSVKRSQPALPISKIDDRLEQYTQAIETAGRNAKLTRQPSIELPSMAVASTKSLWESGEVQAQAAAKSPSCKDIVAGDMSKKSLWEHKGGSKTSSTVKSTPSGKRYKFVATGHGKYEKVLMDEGSGP